MSIMETNNIIPFKAIRPTEMVKDEIKARGMSKKEFAERMEMKASNVSRFLKGEDITVSVANKLEKALDIDAGMWLRLQSSYEKNVKEIKKRDEKENAAVNKEHLLSKMFNLNILYKHLNIDICDFIQNKLKQLQDCLGVDPMDFGLNKFSSQICYKKSDKLEINEINQNTWIVLAYINARKAMIEFPFKKGNALKAATEISALVRKISVTEEEIHFVLNKYGIIYEIVPKLEKVPIDGVSMNIDGNPAIVVTHRYDNMAMLIFTIMHELGHIEKHMFNNGAEIYISSDKEYSTTNPMEHEANEFAEDLLIDKNTWKKIMSTGTSSLWEKNIVGNLKKTAEKYNLNPEIVIWRYKHDSKRYNLYGSSSYRIK